MTPFRLSALSALLVEGAQTATQLMFSRGGYLALATNKNSVIFHINRVKHTISTTLEYYMNVSCLTGISQNPHLYPG